MKTGWENPAHLVSTVSSQLLAGAPVLAGIYLTFVDLFLAEPASVARATSAGEIIDTINTDPTIATVIGHTVVDVLLASWSSEALGAGTGEGVQTVPTDSPIEAWVGGAVVDVFLTVRPSKSINTGTAITIDTVHTDPTVLAGIWGTFVYICLTELASVTCGENYIRNITSLLLVLDYLLLLLLWSVSR